MHRTHMDAEWDSVNRRTRSEIKAGAAGADANPSGFTSEGSQEIHICFILMPLPTGLNAQPGASRKIGSTGPSPSRS